MSRRFPGIKHKDDYVTPHFTFENLPLKFVLSHSLFSSAHLWLDDKIFKGDTVPGQKNADFSMQVIYITSKQDLSAS